MIAVCRSKLYLRNAIGDLQTNKRARSGKEIMAGQFELKRSGDQFMFNLKASGNHEIILTSERYTQKASALNGIESTKTNAPIENRYERKVASNGQPYFVLRAANHEVIGTSQRYSSAAARDNGIAAVKQNAPGATVQDITE